MTQSRSIPHTKHVKRSTGCAFCSHFMNERPDNPWDDYESTVPEHIANVLTHAIPAVLCAFLLLNMVDTVVNTQREAIAAWVYGLCMVLLFTVSASYHACCLMFPRLHSVTEFFRTADYSAIYVFIAATYTPWLVLLELGIDNIYGKIMAVFVWAIAVFGVIKSFTKILPKLHALVLLLSMGWIFVLIIHPVYHSAIPGVAIAEMMIGAGFYTIGIFFLRSDGVIPFAHAIWHVFVVTACFFHLHSTHVYLMNLE